MAAAAATSPSVNLISGTAIADNRPIRRLPLVKLGFRPRSKQGSRIEATTRVDSRRWISYFEDLWAWNSEKPNRCPEHLVIMVNGLVGSADDWRFAAEQFVKKFPDKVIVHRSECNSLTLTFDGVDLMGQRLADEVISIVNRRNGVQKISFVAHSLGGLIARYAIGKLYESVTMDSPANGYHVNEEKRLEGRIAGLVPMNFITFATPHLGSGGHRQLPLLGGLPFLERSASEAAHLSNPRVNKSENSMVEPLDSTPPNPIEQSQCEGEGMELALKEKEEEDDPNYDPAIEPDDVAAPAKRKRGRRPKAQNKKQPAAAKKKDEEEVCFLCFDGGNLVCCDRRGCPKVYHAACINRDEAFFQTKGKWNCGWHICSVCEKGVQYMCYTCTYSLCKGCIKESRFACVRGKKGFCENCYGTVKLIESKDHGSDEKVGINFDDKNSFEYLFRDYWFDVKRRLSLTVEELQNAKLPLKGSVTYAYNKDSSSDESYNANDEEEASSDSSSGHREGSTSSRKKVRRRSRTTVAEESTAIRQVDNVETSIPEDSEWASKELLELVAHMKGGDKSVLSQFDVQALLLDYIKQNNLRDPRRKSQIICDQRLENLFSKARVGHFEMLKLLELHFPIKEASHVVTDDNQGTGADLDSGQMDAEAYADGATKGSDKRRKNRKKIGEREPQTNLDDFAAIDVHNINLIYLRRNLMEDLLDDVDTFTEKVVGSFVRIRIPSTGQKQDMYRLAQVVGTPKVAERYKTSRKTTDFSLEILNLSKKEIITIESISNQEFTEEECKRLRQSIKCGLINRFTVGDIQEKARVLQAVRVNDWLESEKQRLGHLRDRASETGRRKELRECVEKLQLLSTPEERARKLNEVPEIHSDPKMDPDYESADEEESNAKNQVAFSRPRGDSSLRKGKDLLSPGGGTPPSSKWAGGQNGSSCARDSSRNTRTEGARDKLETLYTAGTERTNEPWNNNLEASVWNNNIPAPEATKEPLTTDDTNETGKIWNYRDPAGKNQGPFSMAQLKKWDTTGYFPVDLRIWRTSENEEDSILLADALVGKFEKDLPQWEPPESNNYSHPTPTFANGSNNIAQVGNNANSIVQNATEVRSGIANTWSGQVQPQVHSISRPIAPPFYGNLYGPPSYQDHTSNWGSNNPKQPQPVGPVGHGYGPQPSNWDFSDQQSSRNQWVNGSYNLPTPIPQPSVRAWAPPASPTPGAQPMGTGWGSMNVITAPTPNVHPMGTGWGTMNVPPSSTPFQHMGTVWGSNSASMPNMANQTTGVNSARFPDVAENHSSVFPRNEVISSSNAAVSSFATSSDISRVNKEFFESGCPSPTPNTETQPEANERMGSGPFLSPSPSTLKSVPLKLESSNPLDGMSPIRDTEAKLTSPSLTTMPSHELNVQTGNLDGPGGEMWSLPEPTPSTASSGNNQNNPWISSDAPSSGRGLPPQDANTTSNPTRGWGTWQGVMNTAATVEDGKNTVKETGQGDANGWGTPSGNNQNNPWISSDAPSSGRGLPSQDAYTTANPSRGWGTWQGVTNTTATVEDGKNAVWETGQGDANGWGTQLNQSVDGYNRGGHGRYDSRRESDSRRDGDLRRESYLRREHDSRYGGDSRYDSRYGSELRYDSRHGGGRSQRNERMYHDRDRDRGWRSSKMAPSGGGGGQAQGICKFHESGYCKKGANCNFVHS